MMDKGGRYDRKGGMHKPAFKKKICKFCTQKQEPDYKNPDMLRRYTTERGKILPARITGCCAKHQRKVTAEIKKARVLAYLPFEKK
ncbi:MAG: 30S ribosomal protein S18 [Sphaerochaetaceae bacterium]